MDSGTREIVAGLSAGERFQTTIWSEVLRAGGADAGETRAVEALESLCCNYWYPIYAYIRRRGHDAHAAQDLTQGFFSDLLQRDYLRKADRTKGRFRSFLITAVKWHLADEWDRTNAEKRGGRAVTFSLDEQAAENRYQHEPRSEEEPERLFDRHWAELVFEKVLGELRGEWVSQGHESQYDQLSGAMLNAGNARPYAEIAADLGMTENGVKSAVRRLRRRCGELFRIQIAQTVADDQETDDEVRYLISLLSTE